MIVDQIDIMGVAVFQAKDDAPVGRNPNGPESMQISRQRMQAETRQVHVRRPGGDVETASTRSILFTNCNGSLRRLPVS
jgi:hypothetical protein